jgi:putative ABC transport system substrate-binding protein
MPGNFHPQGKALKKCALLAAVAAVTLLASGCAKTTKVYRVGILVGADTMDAIADGFKTRMTELGYVEGKNIEYDAQKSNADPTEEKRIAAQFVTDRVDLVFAFPGQPAGAVKAAAQGTTIPIVFANAILEGTSLVDSVRSPGGNITGVRNPGPDLTLKSFESLLELIPKARRILAIYDPTYPTNPLVLETLRSVALSSHVELQEVRIPDVPKISAVLQ